MMGETIDKNFTYNNIFVTSEILKIVQWVLEINKITKITMHIPTLVTPG